MQNEAVARRLGAAPSSPSFGDSVARLALDAEIASSGILLSPLIELVRSPGVAPGHVAVRKHLPGEEPFCC